TGFTSILENLPALIQNAGWEFTASTTNIKSEYFKWASNFNITIARNKLLAFPGLATSTYSAEYVVGYPLNILKNLPTQGVNPSTGIYQLASTNLTTGETSITSLDPQ